MLFSHQQMQVHLLANKSARDIYQYEMRLRDIGLGVIRAHEDEHAGKI